MFIIEKLPLYSETVSVVNICYVHISNYTIESRSTLYKKGLCIKKNTKENVNCSFLCVLVLKVKPQSNRVLLFLFHTDTRLLISLFARRGANVFTQIKSMYLEYLAPKLQFYFYMYWRMFGNFPNPYKDLSN